MYVNGVRDSTIGPPRVPKGAGNKGSGALGLYGGHLLGVFSPMKFDAMVKNAWILFIIGHWTKS